MDTRILMAGICAAGLLMSCSGGGGGSDSAPSTAQHAPRMEQVAEQDVPTIFVNVVVITKDDGTGNELWDEAYVRQLLTEATELTGSVVYFQLQHLTELASGADYAMNQKSLLHALKPLRMPGIVTVIISQPETTDTAGLSQVQYASSPYLVMRARVQDWSGIEEAAKILLHELGHQINLAHELGVQPFHTDDYYTRDDGRQYLADYAAFLQE